MTVEEAFNLESCPTCGGTQLIKVKKTGLVSCMKHGCWMIRFKPVIESKRKKK